MYKALNALMNRISIKITIVPRIEQCVARYSKLGFQIIQCINLEMEKQTSRRGVKKLFKMSLIFINIRVLV